MIGALVRQAAHAGLVAEPGFTGKELRWMVQVSGGRYVGVIPLGDGKAGQVFRRAPDLSHPNLMALPKYLGTEQAAHFLADTCGVVTLLPALDRDGNSKTDTKSLTDQAKSETKHLAFVELLRRAGESVPDIQTVYEMLSDDEQMAALQADLIRLGAKPTDKLSFSVNGELLLDKADWHDWWRDFRRQAFGRSEAESGGGMLDLTTGELVTPANTHPKLTKLGVGAIAVGASLIGYDKEAFSSYGLNAGENGAVSEDNAAAYRAALDALLDDAPVLGQMKVAAWFDHREAEGQALVNALVDPSTLPENTQEELDAGEPDDYNASEDEQPLVSSARQQEAVAKQRARKLLTAIRRGEQPDNLTARYFALAISGASGRAMVRDWHTGSLEELAQAVATWFADLAIATPSGRNAKRPKFFSLLLYVQRPKPASTGLDDYLRPIRNLQLPFWRAALEPTAPIPFPVIGKVMEAHKAHVMSGKFSEALAREGAPEEKARIYTRMALLRAYHVRQSRANGGHPMTSSLDSQHPSPAYHCGRLMYLLANVQDAQGGDINAGVVQRYYGAASSTPALVLGRLTRLSQHHLAKISRDKPGLAFTLENEIAQVWTALGANLPRTLSLEEQTLFALGYYQQLAHNSAQRQERAAAKRDETSNNARNAQES
ncbi:type I-C CRISPR-associated protein Cas8c/Csd1 [Deinococcus sp.]|uniref:type I-C CRISPR-associated protein Cas8c/Csd1 n=1 Tax=Deinococcus sp. TaxID=47478 RepID=UPI003B5922FA